MKTKQSLLKICVLVAMLLLPAVVRAQFTFTTNNGALTITGYTGTNSIVVIPATTNGFPIVSIAVAAFAYSTLTSVVISDGVTNTGSRAFAECANLTNVTIPSSVTRIEDGVFSYCTSLTSVVIPSSVTNIGDGAFYFCSHLTNLTLPDAVATIGSGSFSECTSLTNFTMPNSLTDMGNYSFLGCTSLTSIVIPNRITNLGYQLFNDCTKLASVTIPNSVASIGDDAFFSCTSLTHVTIPDSVISLGSHVFADCIYLKEIFFHGNAPMFVGSDAFFHTTNVTAYFLPGTIGWEATFAGRPTGLWRLPYPLILNSSAVVPASDFGFTISWATNIPVVVETSTNLAGHVWQPIKTNTLTGGAAYFNDPQWTNYPGRFYRLRSP